MLDALDREAVLAAVTAAKPEVIVDELTALAGPTDLRRFDAAFATTNRLRTEGTDHLLAAARAAGTRRLVAQSFAGWPNPRTGGPVKTEDDPLDPHPTAECGDPSPPSATESTVPGPGWPAWCCGTAPSTAPAPAGSGGEVLEMVRRRRLPDRRRWHRRVVVRPHRRRGPGHRRRPRGGAPGLYNIVDDEPAPVAEWLPYLARCIGARPPMRVPAWLARVLIGEHGVSMMTAVRGSSNAKAKRELGWRPMYPSWRQGFREGLS